MTSVSSNPKHFFQIGYKPVNIPRENAVVSEAGKSIAPDEERNSREKHTTNQLIENNQDTMTNPQVRKSDSTNAGYGVGRKYYDHWAAKNNKTMYKDIQPDDTRNPYSRNNFKKIIEEFADYMATGARTMNGDSFLAPDVCRQYFSNFWNSLTKGEDRFSNFSQPAWYSGMNQQIVATATREAYKRGKVGNLKRKNAVRAAAHSDMICELFVTGNSKAAWQVFTEWYEIFNFFL